MSGFCTAFEKQVSYLLDISFPLLMELFGWAGLATGTWLMYVVKAILLKTSWIIWVRCCLKLGCMSTDTDSWFGTSKRTRCQCPCFSIAWMRRAPLPRWSIIRSRKLPSTMCLSASPVCSVKMMKISHMLVRFPCSKRSARVVVVAFIVFFFCSRCRVESAVGTPSRRRRNRHQLWLTHS